jgi:hypothetical protein
MFYPARAFLLSLMIVAVLAFSAVGTTVVYADGGTTPEAPPTEVSGGDECSSDDGECEPEDDDTATEPPVATEEPGTVTVDTIDTSEPVESEETTPTEVPVEETATPVPTEEVVTPPAEETATPVPTEEVTPPTEDNVATPETVPAETTPPAETPILDSVPDNTTVAVLNAEGELQPLATQASADAIATSDPIWCPAGQSPTPGQNGCTQSFTSFTALLTFLSGNTSYAGAGTIYVQQGTYQGGESTIDFNNYDLSNISSADLTIAGGWNTSTGAVDSTSTLNGVSLVIGTSTNPWGGTLSLSNLILTNPAQTGITLNTGGDINLTNVSVTNSTNGAGAELNAGGNVTIEDSKFERNKTAGAIIRAVGDVAISNSSFSNPANARRQIVGLDIISDGSVSLFQVLANENRQAGATIQAAGRVTIVQSEFSGTKAIVGSDFLGYGLTVVSQDAIDLESVTANDNFLWGASLTAAGDVTIANSVFNANTTESPGFIDDTGLLVTSGANVFIINSHADDNRLIGAVIDAVGDVAISNSTFSSNNGVILDAAGNPTFYGYGLQVTTDGAITISGVTASGNTLFGAHLESGGDVTVINSDFSNQTSGDATTQTGRGLEIITAGNVFLDTVTLNNNQTFGADIQAGGDVFLDAVTASNNGTNGVVVETTCNTLFLIGGTYTNNGQYGLSVLSTALTQTVAPVFSGNGVGNLLQDPGTCTFTPPTPPTPPYQPNDLGAVEPKVSSNGNLKSNLKYSNDVLVGLLTASASESTRSMTFNSFLAASSLGSTTHIGVFSGRYAYVYLSSGMQIVLYSPISLNEIAMNR